MKRPTVFVVVLIVTSIARALVAAPAEPLVSAAEQKAAAAITESSIRADVRFLASDMLGGRGPASEGDRLAQLYIASRMEAMGLRPAAPGGGWIQKVPLVGMTAKVPDTMTFTAGGKTLDLKNREDFIGISGVQEPRARIENAEVVFVGYGIVAPEYGWNDYKDADLKGKVLLMMNNDPEEDPAFFGGKTRLWYGRWDYKYQIAAKQGAVGVILIHTVPSAGYPWQVVQTSWSGEKFELPYEGEPRVQIKSWATDEASKRVAALGGKDLDRLRASAQKKDFRPVPLGVRLSFSLENSVQKVESGNVLGKIPGRDPKRSDEIVLYTAHHDHLGTKKGASAGEDAIYNGALDNASGVAAMLAIASAFTRLPEPAGRTVVFGSVTAEEQGLLGSEYLARHPPVPPGKIAANINIDGVNIMGRTHDLTMVGLGKSNLDETLLALAKMQGRVVKPDQFPDRGFFYRSDQFNLAKVGVPAAYLDAGTEVLGKPAGWGKEQIEKWEATHYHQPSDELRDEWNLEGAVEDTSLLFYLGAKVANSEALPRWNKGDEFEAARQKALAETK